MLLRRRAAAVASLCAAQWLGSLEIIGAVASNLECPLGVPPATLTMACGAACPNPLSPCLYYASAGDCVADEDSGSVCVTSSGVATASCAIECFSPFSGDGGSGDWTFMVTTEGEYKRDVAARRARDPAFRLAKKPLKQLATVRDIRFPAVTKTISISGNALPILDKAVDYPVIYNGFSVAIDMGNFSFLENAQTATTILLENINLTGLTTFPSLPQLKTLQLSNSKLRAIPKGIAKLPALERLEVSLTTLISITDGLLPMTLVDLCLQDCGLEELPPGIASMTKLKKLDLAGNKFPLPPVGSLPLQVEQLVWWGFYHKLLPPDFPKMTKLKILELGWNDFSDASALALLPTSLEELHLMEASLAELPISFTNLTKLAWMELGKNNIKRVAKQTLPPSLKFLNLSINFLSEIEAGALPTGLEALDVRLNKLECSSFPADFASLTSLQALYLHDNALDCIPSGLFGFKKLETLTLHRNDNLSRLTFNSTEVAFLSQLKNFQIDQRCLETSCKKPTSIGSTNYTVCLTGDPTIANKTTSGSRTGGAPGSGNKALIIGLAVAIGGLVAILIGAVHWKRRRDTANGVMHHARGHDGKAGLKPLGAMELHVIEEQLRDGEGASDATAYAEMAHAEAHSANRPSGLSQSLLSSLVTNSEASMSESHIKRTKKTTTTTTTTITTATSSEIRAASTSSDSTRNDNAVQKTGASRVSVWDDDAEMLQWRVDGAAIRAVQLLSSGTHGEVWLAIYMSCHVAVKRLKKPLGVKGDDTGNVRHRRATELFVQEIKLHARLVHPRIVSFLGVAWTTDSDLQVVLEYMTMGDLRTFLSSLQPKFETLTDDGYEGDDNEHHWDAAALQIAIDIADVLVHLHSLDAPVLHRDLKSRNILVDDSLHAKVTGFGVARYPFDGDTTLVTPATMVRWAAPEVLIGSDASCTCAIDVYSLGIILSELDTWSVPFSEHVSITDTALMNRVIVGELMPRFRSSSPQEIVTLAKRCLSTDPKKRPTAVEVADMLRQCLVESQSQTIQTSHQQHIHGLASASRGSMGSNRASLTAVGAAVAMSL